MKRIAFLTDVHLDEQFPIDNGVNPYINLETVLADLVKKNISELVFGGDIGDASAYKYFFDVLKNFNIQLILGNHDKYDEVKLFFNKNTDKSELYYKEEDENHLSIFLDTSSDEISENQLNWLESELRNDKAVIVFIHHPVLAINTAVDTLYPLKNREQLRSVLMKHNKSVTIFCGHYHMNDEQTHSNIKQITTQSLSFQLEKNSEEIKVDNSNFGYRIIDVDHRNIDTQVVLFENRTNSK